MLADTLFWTLTPLRVVENTSTFPLIALCTDFEYSLQARGKFGSQALVQHLVYILYFNQVTLLQYTTSIHRLNLDPQPSNIRVRKYRLYSE